MVSRTSAALCSATQHAMPPELGGKWGTECHNTRFPLPTLLCAEYNVKLVFFYIDQIKEYFVKFSFIIYIILYINICFTNMIS